MKEYPPEHHALSHESNPLAAQVSLVRQKIKDDAKVTNPSLSKIAGEVMERMKETPFLAKRLQSIGSS